MTIESNQTIYKILGRDKWKQAEVDGVFQGAAIDLTDGYIHFSTATQVAETAARHFAGRADLLLLAVDTRGLGDQLRWETSRGGELFPHLYCDLELANVKWVKEIQQDETGIHQFAGLGIE